MCNKWCTPQKSLLDNAPNLLVGCVIQKGWMYSSASSHESWCAKNAVYTFCTSCIEVEKKKNLHICTWQKLGFYKKNLLSKEKKRSFWRFQQLVLTLKWKKLVFKHGYWIYKVLVHLAHNHTLKWVRTKGLGDLFSYNARWSKW